MPATTVKLGPGLLSIGQTGTEVDFTCQVIGAQVEWSVDTEDDVPVLCGETVPGARTYSSVLTGSLFQDLGSVTPGIVEYTWDHKGEEVPFVFVPSTSAGKQVAGTVILDPLTVGGDTAGDNMQSDFEWAITGEPVLGDALPLTAEAATSSKAKAKTAEPVGA